jgi:hypothetical protein
MTLQFMQPAASSPIFQFDHRIYLPAWVTHYWKAAGKMTKSWHWTRMASGQADRLMVGGLEGAFAPSVESDN